jgi:hypothetical protein
MLLILALSVPQQDSKKGSYEGTENVASMILSVDVTCILRTWRILGVFACPSPKGGVNTCLIVENAYPVGIVEAVRRPFTSHLVEASALFKLFEEVPRFGETSSHTNGAGDGTKLQFAEAHAYEFVPDLQITSQLQIAQPSGNIFRFSYASEIDGYFWRTGFAEMLLHPEQALKRALLPSCSTVPRADDCAWSWGPWFPRIGFTVHPSEVMASHLTALRAGRVASAPLGRIVISPYPYEPRSGHYVQMVRPTRRSCVSIGWPVVRQIELKALSLEGAYLYIHFGIFQECNGCFPARLVEPRPPQP